ncbi:hypothetical protein ERO13_A05G413050v2 [Gossypium hirsutum]|uniref:RNase H type-1 domain-containing protein n=1 Tax=Gossypium darwinii TaxID=34276 RepID=A0A5D2GSG4_GOSDA|nr:hypothetical protein ERO13_A05G413050v2 [Gossypium hirsutum]TYH20862.1 hypothetical protein ES288_A05G462500v1 [Gossypium darwinii]
MLWKIRRNAMVFSEEFTDASSFFARCIWYKDETRLESSSLGNQVWRDISWSAPPMGVSKVNVDGAYSAGTSRTLLLVLGCGALHTTLVVAISIKRAPHTTIRAIGEMLQRDWDVTITHVYRESKRATDNLAKYVARLPFGIFSFPSDATGLPIPSLIHI